MNIIILIAIQAGKNANAGMFESKQVQIQTYTILALPEQRTNPVKEYLHISISVLALTSIEICKYTSINRKTVKQMPLHTGN